MALQQGVSDRSLDKWLAKLSPCRKVFASAPFCFLTGTRAKWRCQLLLCTQRPLLPCIRVAVETSIPVGRLEHLQHGLKTTPGDFTKLQIWAITKSEFLSFVSYFCSLQGLRSVRTLVIVFVPVYVYSLSVLLCRVPWGWKSCLSSNPSLFAPAEAICDVNSLYMETSQKQQALPWILFSRILPINTGLTEKATGF